MSWDRVHAEAEVLEHVLSEELEELIAARLGRPVGRPARRSDPHARVRDRRAPDTQPGRAAGRCRGTLRARVGLRPGDAALPRRARHHARRSARGRRSPAVRWTGVRAVRRARASDRRRARTRDADRDRRGTSGDPAARPAGSRARGRRRRPDAAAVRGARGERARAAPLAWAGARDAVHARPRVRRLDRVRRPRQLRHQRAGRRPVRLPAAVGRAGSEPDRDGDPVPLGEARDRHRPQLSRTRPRALPARVHLGNVGASRDHGDVDRHRRVHRRRDRPEPAVRRAAAPRRADHRRDRVRDPRAADPRLPPLRARDQRAARDHLRRLPLRDAANRTLRARLAARPDPQHPRHDLSLPRGRDRRRDRDATRDLPALRADQGPHAVPQRPREEARAALRTPRRDTSRSGSPGSSTWRCSPSPPSSSTPQPSRA